MADHIHSSSTTPQLSYSQTLSSANINLIALSALVLLFLAYKLYASTTRYLRFLLTTNDPRQTHFIYQTRWTNLFKRHVLYAPILGSHHQSGWKFMRVWRFLFVPTRFQGMLLAGLLTMNIALLLYGVDVVGRDASSYQTMCVALRTRSGYLALANMIPLVLLSGRNSPLTYLMDIPYETFSLVHRWLGRIVVGQILTHTLMWALKTYDAAGLSAIFAAMRTSSLIITGVVGTAAAIAVLMFSISVFRRAFYETFLHAHIILVIVLLVGTYLHVDGDATALIYVRLVICLWAAERAVRIIRILYYNVSLRKSTAIEVESLPGQAMRVRIETAREMTFKPGQHIFLSVPSLGLWTCHPFSVVWCDDLSSSSSSSSESSSRDGSPIPTSKYANATHWPLPGPIDFKDKDKEFGLSIDEKSISPLSRTNTLPSINTPSHPLGTPTRHIEIIVRTRTGLTAQLYSAVKSHAYASGTLPGTPLRLRGYIEGPYSASSSSDELTSYGTVLLFGGGVGITALIPQIESILRLSSQNLSSTRAVHLVWAVQSISHASWIQPYMAHLASLSRTSAARLKISIFVTRSPLPSPAPSAPSSAELTLPFTVPSSLTRAVSVSAGRPGISSVLEAATREQVGKMAVLVCGTSGMSDSVRAATRGVLERGRNVDFIERCFGW